MTKQRMIIDAALRASSWFEEADEAVERGEPRAAEAYYAKGQYWFDRLNRLVAAQ